MGGAARCIAVGLSAASVAGVGAKVPGRQPPVLGWNTWCTQNECGKDWCSAAEVLSVGASMKAEGLLAAGYDRLHLDDCWGIRNPTTLCETLGRTRTRGWRRASTRPQRCRRTTRCSSGSLSDK